MITIVPSAVTSKGIYSSQITEKENIWVKGGVRNRICLHSVLKGTLIRKRILFYFKKCKHLLNGDVEAAYTLTMVFLFRFSHKDF